MEGKNIAIYLDFENLAISAETVYPSQDKPLLLEPILDFIASKGTVCQKKTYADWSKDIFSQYQSKLMEFGFELIHLPETNLQGKNGSDVRLTIDVMEYMTTFPGIDLIVIGSGDTDFIPLIQRLRMYGKEVIVLGFEHSVGKLVKRNSTEFKSLEELIGEPEAESLFSGMNDEPDLAAGRELMSRFIRTHNSSEPVLMAKLKQQLLRLEGSFSEKNLGFSSFKQFVHSLEGDLVEKVDSSDSTLPLVYLKEKGLNGTHKAKPDTRENAIQFLSRKLRYQNDLEIRLSISDPLFECLKNSDPISMSEMFDKISNEIPESIPKTDIRKYINTLFTGGAFIPVEKKAGGPLLSRPFKLKETIQNAEHLDQVYIQRVSEILQSRYEELDTHTLLELLI